MKYLIITLFFSICLSEPCDAQIPKIKTQLKEIFFDLSTPCTKYEARKKLHSLNNISDIHEWFNAEPDKKYDLLNFSFSENYKLSYLNKAKVKDGTIWYYKGTDSNFCFGFSIKYFPKDNEICTNQYDEIIDFFKSISYKISNEPYNYDGQQKGMIFYAFSSANQLKKSNPYLILSSKFEVSCETCTDKNEYYTIDFTFYNQYLK